jgi:hypothetical protein
MKRMKKGVEVLGNCGGTGGCIICAINTASKGITGNCTEGQELLVLLLNMRVCPGRGNCRIGMAVVLALGLGLLNWKGMGVWVLLED